ncbi:MAG TPA: 30S ribosomal protein S8 [Myxococcales bacterium]|jgi:small subunit ribosomal protein S8|nr:30S ribosomal protein S8 [Myxococcales bacterium]
MMTDPIGDMLTRIRNAGRVNHAEVRCSSSQLKVAVAKVLSEEGFVAGFRIEDSENKPILVVDLRYSKSGDAMIDSVQRVSRPGRRVYLGASDLKEVRGGLGMTILSTSHGVMCDRDARKQKVGGEVLCEVW